jgi:hypothetical protein
MGRGLLAAAVAPPRAAAEPNAGPSAKVGQNETSKTIRSLGTIHGDFSDKQAPDEAVQTILNTSVRAARASAMQSYSVAVVREAAIMSKLTGYRGSWLPLYRVSRTRFVNCAPHFG